MGEVSLLWPQPELSKPPAQACPQHRLHLLTSRGKMKTENSLDASFEADKGH